MYAINKIMLIVLDILKATAPPYTPKPMRSLDTRSHMKAICRRTEMEMTTNAGVM